MPRTLRSAWVALVVSTAVLGCSGPAPGADPSSGPTGPASTGPATSIPAASGTALPAGWAETEMTFATTSGTAYGTLARPAGAGPVPGALLIAGSGPTDRNGDQRGFVTGSLRAVAGMLARAGVASLRYDKLGSGRTGVGTVTDPATITLNTFADQAQAALRTLADAPGIDASRLLVVGHSEGALYAQLLATRPVLDGPRVSRIALVMPLALRYLDLIGKQVRGQIVAASALGSISPEQAQRLRGQLDAATAAIRAGTAVPAALDPSLAGLFAPANVGYLRTADAVDPLALARQTPGGMPVLVVCGTDDVQVDCPDAQALATAVPSGAGHLVELAGVSHVLKVDGSRNPANYTADLPYSPELERALAGLVTG